MSKLFRSWTKEEENDLLVEFKSLPIDEIATKHNRTKRAIEIRLQDIAVKMDNNGVSRETILSETGVSSEALEKRKKEKEKEMSLLLLLLN